MQGKSILGYTKLSMGCLEDEPKVGKGMVLADLWRNKCGKIEE